MICFRSSDRPSAVASILTVTSAAVRDSRSYGGVGGEPKKQNKKNNKVLKRLNTTSLFVKLAPVCFGG